MVLMGVCGFGKVGMMEAVEARYLILSWIFLGLVLVDKVFGCGEGKGGMELGELILIAVDNGMTLTTHFAALSSNTVRSRTNDCIS